MKEFIFDTETTGVQFWRNCIHQISGMIIIDSEIKEKFDFKVRPHPSAIIEEEALKVANVKLDDILLYPTQQEVYTELIKILSKYCDKYNKSDKFHLVGYNIASFDIPFLRAFFKQCNDNYFGSWFYPDCLDVYVLASNRLKNVRNELGNFKQSTVAKYLGIEVDESKLHDAIYDVEICYSIYKKIE